MASDNSHNLRLFPEDDDHQPLPVVSFSKVSAFLRCPFEYHAVYVDAAARRVRSGAEVQAGVSLHRVLHSLLESCRSDLTEQSMREAFRRSWDHSAFQSTDQSEEWMSQCLGWTLRLRDELENAPHVALEAKFRALLPSCVLTGRIDRIDRLSSQNYRIVDYKMFPYSEATDMRLQAALYAEGARTSLGVTPSVMRFVIVSDGTVEDLEIDQDLCVWGLNLVRETVEQINNATEFYPRHNSLCRTCDLVDRCGVETNGRVLEGN